ncbi:uncharacterized protein JCM6883_002138 [Sporobolomyces salmoneus]|uniref:uncharacterized protein n=1 Tax=Sporobolomyces salmoneus TaxID=183962 RepID=UPI00317090C8
MFDRMGFKRDLSRTGGSPSARTVTRRLENAQILNVSGYCSRSRRLRSTSFPPSHIPSCQLTELKLTDMALPGRLIFSLIGSDPKSLTLLALCSVTSITNDVLEEVFELVGSTLNELRLEDDSSMAGPYESQIFSPLVNLTRFFFTSDDDWTEDILTAVCTLSKIITVSVFVPSLSRRTATAALEGASLTLESLEIRVWNVNLWDIEGLWSFTKVCIAKDVAFSINEMDEDDIEDDQIAPIYVLDRPREPKEEMEEPVEDLAGFFELNTEDEEKEEPMARTPVKLPVEVIRAILEKTQEGYGRSSAQVELLKNASLVCKLWTDPARTILFRQINNVENAPASVQRLRSVFERYPELGRSVEMVDLTNLAIKLTAKNVNETFRQFAGLLRVTPVIKDISYLHVELSDKARDRFFAALGALNPRTAKIYDPSQVPMTFAPQGGPRVAEDIRALGKLLTEWKTLKILTLAGFSDRTRLLTLTMFPAHQFPTYQLTRLDLSQVELPGRSLVSLLGSSPKSLTTLKLSSIIHLTSDVLAEAFELVGPTLVNLQIFSDIEQGFGTDPYERRVFTPLVNLVSLDFNASDTFFEDIFETICSLPSIKTIAMTVPSLSHARAMAALKEPSWTLAEMSIDIWEENLWPAGDLWSFAKRCDFSGVSLYLTGMDDDDIVDEWFGPDFSND